MQSKRPESVDLRMRKNKKSLNLRPIVETAFYRFLRHVTKSKSLNRENIYKLNRYKRILHALPEDTKGFIDLMCVDDKCLMPTLKLHPEFAAFIFHIDGCAKNLLFYIIMYELNHENGQYAFNAQIRAQFNSYCQELFNSSFKDTTIDQAHRALEEKNIICNIRKGVYFLNPLVAGGKTESLRRKLINDYTQLLHTKKQKDSFNDIYPVFTT